MIYKNKFFWLSVFCVMIQQILVGLSTYFIGLAGMSAQYNINQSFFYIIIFFLTISMCYIFGSASLYFRVKLSNTTWSSYYHHLINEVRTNGFFSSSKNKIKTNNWINGEALPTIDEASFYFVEIIALYCNVVFTIIALAAILGFDISAAISCSLFISSVLLFVFKSKINLYAQEIQNEKVSTFSAINRIWDNAFFGLKRHYVESLNNADKEEKKYFNNMEKYKLLEQILACFPIIITIPFILYFSHSVIERNPEIMGALIAVLPRSLQLFQSIHAASMHTTQLFLIRSKLANLKKFSTQLERVDFSKKYSSNVINVYALKDDGEKNYNLAVSDFIKIICNNEVNNGRYLLNGPNGSGKSSILKTIKNMKSNSVLLGNNTEIGYVDIDGSTGQKHGSYITSLLKTEDCDILLLDEWDANLDHINMSKLDDKINQIAKSKLIIEVRHRGNIILPD